MSQEKRQRSVNFTNEEKINLLYIIRKYKNIIENKETGGVTWKNKEEAWKNVEREFSSTSSTPRLVEVLKRFYNNKKKETRKQASLQKVEFNRTGGGMPIVEVKDDPVFNLTLDIINKKTVFGLHNKFDDDAESDVEQVQPNAVNHEQSVIANLANNDGIIIFPMDDDKMEDNFVEEPPAKLLICTPSSSGRTVGGSSCTPSSSGRIVGGSSSPLSTVASSSTAGRAAINIKSGDGKRKHKSHFSKGENVALKYEEVADIKKSVFDMQLSILTACKEDLDEKREYERNHRKLREFREQEEHELKKKALNLDIEIKEAQV
ncbi:unnamed protein product [Psylliodes chrysocephalus]|uniref:Regulatory protein zeste n=1 Tax=Psylliodes chrysocephalus TaxID=3402493 RepID=A0A9P0D002_9CUCU|nr:unnamed protein product [Psylliodes chrysocephala]